MGAVSLVGCEDEGETAPGMAQPRREQVAPEREAWPAPAEEEEAEEEQEETLTPAEPEEAEPAQPGGGETEAWPE
ncbi:MAG: hypothetical protein R6X33_11565 [Candidatus Brocadiia bacterium]